MMREIKRTINKIFKEYGYVTYREFTFTIHTTNIHVFNWISLLIRKFVGKDEIEMYKIAIDFFKNKKKSIEKLALSDSEKAYRINLIETFLKNAQKELRKMLVKTI